MFDEILVDSDTLKDDYMGLLGFNGVHIPTSMIPRGNYRIREVYSRFIKLRYRCHSCTAISEFRGKNNRCPECGTLRKVRRFRKVRKFKIWFAVRYVRRFIKFDYYRDHDWSARCNDCGTYLKRTWYDGPYDYCNRCDHHQRPRFTLLHERLNSRAIIDDELFVIWAYALDDDLKCLLDKVIGHKRDRKPIQWIPILEPCRNHNLMFIWYEIQQREWEQRQQEAVA